MKEKLLKIKELLTILLNKQYSEDVEYIFNLTDFLILGKINFTESVLKNIINEVFLVFNFNPSNEIAEVLTLYRSIEEELCQI